MGDVAGAMMTGNYNKIGKKLMDAQNKKSAAGKTGNQPTASAGGLKNAPKPSGAQQNMRTSMTGNAQNPVQTKPAGSTGAPPKAPEKPKTSVSAPKPAEGKAPTLNPTNRPTQNAAQSVTQSAMRNTAQSAPQRPPQTEKPPVVPPTSNRQQQQQQQQMNEAMIYTMNKNNDADNDAGGDVADNNQQTQQPNDVNLNVNLGTRPRGKNVRSKRPRGTQNDFVKAMFDDAFGAENQQPGDAQSPQENTDRTDDGNPRNLPNSERNS